MRTRNGTELGNFGWVPSLRMSATERGPIDRGMDQIAEPFFALVAGAAFGIAFVDAGRALKRAKAFVARRRV